MKYIDRGHNRKGDRGAVNGSLIENDMANATAKGMHDSFVSHGFPAKLEDGDLSIADSAKAANKLGADMLISIHYNAGGGNRGEVIHSVRKDGSKELAEVIALGLKDAGQSTVKVYPWPKDGAPNTDHLGILRGAKMKACLVEVCFIDNSTDAKDFGTFAEQYNAGVCIARRIMAAYKQK